MFQSLGKMYVCTFGKYTNGTPNLKASGVPPPPAPPRRMRERVGVRLVFSRNSGLWTFSQRNLWKTYFRSKIWRSDQLLNS